MRLIEYSFKVTKCFYVIKNSVSLTKKYTHKVEVYLVTRYLKLYIKLRIIKSLGF